MANTFKVFTIADVAIDSGTFSTIYTVAGSTTGIVLGLNICNKDGIDVSSFVHNLFSIL